MNQLNISEITKGVAIPPKTRSMKPSPLFLKLDQVGIGGSFVIEDVKVADVSATVYATAKRAGVKVSLRQLDNGVGVWRIHNESPQTDLEIYKEQAAQPRRGRRAA